MLHLNPTFLPLIPLLPYRKQRWLQKNKKLLISLKFKFNQVYIKTTVEIQFTTIYNFSNFSKIFKQKLEFSRNFFRIGAKKSSEKVLSGFKLHKKYAQARRQSQKKPKIVLASKIQNADAQATMKYILMEHSKTF